MNEPIEAHAYAIEVAYLETCAKVGGGVHRVGIGVVFGDLLGVRCHAVLVQEIHFVAVANEEVKVGFGGQIHPEGFEARIEIITQFNRDA